MIADNFGPMIEIPEGIGTVRLISTTPNGEDLICYAARVSSKKQDKEDKGLLKYCLKNGHVSVFEQADMTVEITCPLAIAVQTLRHRSFTFQQFCVAADTKIHLGGARGSTRTIESLYNMQSKGEKLPNVKTYDDASKEIVERPIKEVFKTGVNTIYEIELMNGLKIKATKDHQFLTICGFKDLDTIIDSYTYLAYFSPVAGEICYESIKAIRFLGEEMTYDLEVDYRSHNYVANFFITHNSQRYQDIDVLQNFAYFPTSVRSQDTKNRQNSLQWQGTDEDERLVLQMVEECYEKIHSTYRKMLNMGVAKEVARFILPEGVTTKLYMKGNIRDWIFYIKTRSEVGVVQHEHVQLARTIFHHIFKPEYPIIASMVEDLIS